MTANTSPDPSLAIIPRDADETICEHCNTKADQLWKCEYCGLLLDRQCMMLEGDCWEESAPCKNHKAAQVHYVEEEEKRYRCLLCGGETTEEPTDHIREHNISWSSSSELENIIARNMKEVGNHE